jgi:hypothetical protein
VSNPVSTTDWWIVGYAVGAVVVVVAATMLLLLIALARRIARQAGEIETALLVAVRNTEPLFDIAMMNHALESITRGVKHAKGEQGAADDRGILARVLRRLLPSGQS